MFSASHRLHNPELSEGENHEIYGKCNNPGGHGHNYFLEVTVAGPVDPRTGMVVNLAEVDECVNRLVVERFDESSLNQLPNFQHLVPTTENLCTEIYRVLKESWGQVPSAREARLERVRLEETSSNFFEFCGGC